jgi:hypothetical protein
VPVHQLNSSETKMQIEIQEVLCCLLWIVLHYSVINILPSQHVHWGWWLSSIKFWWTH